LGVWVAYGGVWGASGARPLTPTPSPTAGRGEQSRGAKHILTGHDPRLRPGRFPRPSFFTAHGLCHKGFP
jgi:hypothetical protein